MLRIIREHVLALGLPLTTVCAWRSVVTGVSWGEQEMKQDADGYAGHVSALRATGRGSAVADSANTTRTSMVGRACQFDATSRRLLQSRTLTTSLPSATPLLHRQASVASAISEPLSAQPHKRGSAVFGSSSNISAVSADAYSLRPTHMPNGDVLAETGADDEESRLRRGFFGSVKVRCSVTWQHIGCKMHALQRALSQLQSKRGLSVAEGLGSTPSTTDEAAPADTKGTFRRSVSLHNKV